MTRFLALLSAAASLAVIYLVTRRHAPADTATLPALEPESDAEPVLGYDGMDIQTVVPWLESANLDDSTLARIRRYELRNRRRQTVLETLDDLMR